MTHYELGRRKMLAASGAALTIGLAGCTGNGDDDDDDNGFQDSDDEFDIAPGTTVELDGYADYWIGQAPADIENIINPTLVLEAGEEYTFEWTNADGVTHDLQIRDEAGDAVDDLVSDTVGSEGDGDSLTFEASSEMVTYICSFHPTSQVGDIVVE